MSGSVPCERYSHSCSAFGSQLLLFGGLSFSGCWLNELHLLDTAASPLCWYAPSTGGCPPPCPRAAHSAVVVGRSLIVFAGNDGKQLFNDLHVLELDSLCWQQPAQHGDVPSPRAGHTCNLLPDSHRLLVFGGGNAARADQRPALPRLPQLDLDAAGGARHSALAARRSHGLRAERQRAARLRRRLPQQSAQRPARLQRRQLPLVPPPPTRATCPSRAPATAAASSAAAGSSSSQAATQRTSFNDLHLLDTSFFRMREQQQQHAAKAAAAQHPDALPHSMSAPSSPSLHARRSLKLRVAAAVCRCGRRRRLGRRRGAAEQRLDECAAQLSSAVSASLQRLEYRQRQVDSDEAELLRLLQAVRDRREAEYRQAADDAQQLQRLIASSLSGLKRDVTSGPQPTRRGGIQPRPGDSGHCACAGCWRLLLLLSSSRPSSASRRHCVRSAAGSGRSLSRQEVAQKEGREDRRPAALIAIYVYSSRFCTLQPRLPTETSVGLPGPLYTRVAPNSVLPPNHLELRIDPFPFTFSRENPC